MLHNYLADAIVKLEPSATEAVDGKVKEMRRQGVSDIISPWCWRTWVRHP